MADEGTLATTAQVLLAIGADASAAQILEANTNIWIKYAESDIYVESGQDFVTDVASIESAGVQYLAEKSADRAAWYAINQGQNTWSLATTQSKLNILDASWQGFLTDMKSADKLALLGFGSN